MLCPGRPPPRRFTQLRLFPLLAQRANAEGPEEQKGGDDNSKRARDPGRNTPTTWSHPRLLPPPPRFERESEDAPESSLLEPLATNNLSAERRSDGGMILDVKFV